MLALFIIALGIGGSVLVIKKARTGDNGSCGTEQEQTCEECGNPKSGCSCGKDLQKLNMYDDDSGNKDESAQKLGCGCDDKEGENSNDNRRNSNVDNRSNSGNSNENK